MPRESVHYIRGRALRAIASARRLELIEALMSEQPATVEELGRHLGRDPKPLSLMQAKATRLFRWVERMNRPDLDVGEFVYTIGDSHIYLNHLDQVSEQLSREPYPLPELLIKRKPPSIFEYAFEDFELLNYHYHPAIKAPVAV